MLHNPVLCAELLSLLSSPRKPYRILDCSFGRGGHSLAFLKAFPQAKVEALDCDRAAVCSGESLKEAEEGRLIVRKQNFHSFPSIASSGSYDLILIDLGASSPQLDEKERGFSFYKEGPLDMRMDREDNPLRASDIVNSWSKKELLGLFQNYGEIKNPHKVVSAIIERRRKKKFQNTMELSHLIQKIHPRRGRFSRHPASRWFLALRIAVNRELEGLESCLPDFASLLRAEGLFAVISFHSLEDRIVKKAFRRLADQGAGRLWSKKALRPGLEEIKRNIRARSAKLRVFQKK